MVSRILLLFILWTPSVSDAQTDSVWHRKLDGIIVKGQRVKSHIEQKQNGDVSLSMQMMDDLPRILGNADPMHYTQLLPGVQTNSEYDAGLHVEGCDNGHNAVLINQVPLYHVAHLLGFFSVFNAIHFTSMQFARTTGDVSSPNRLGGMVNMTGTDSIRARVSGEVSVGPMSSQGTLHLPLAPHWSAKISMRTAYLNLLYGNMLKIDDSQLKYSFADLNFTLTWKADKNNQYWMDVYTGYDRMKMTDQSMVIDTKMDWGNTMISGHWHHQGRVDMQHTLYYTGYHHHFSLNQADIVGSMKSIIGDAGYRLQLQHGAWQEGVHLIAHQMRPQQVEMYYNHENRSVNSYLQHAWEGAAWISYRWRFMPKWDALIGINANGYMLDGCRHAAVDPTLSIFYQMNTHSSWRLSSYVRHQYLIQTGLSEMGLPTEFWMGASSDFPPQYVWGESLAFNWLSRNGKWSVSADVYYKRLYHQVEYLGNLYDFVYGTYALEQAVRTGNGENYGFSVMLEKRKGLITGWLNAQAGRALRSFPSDGLRGDYPARHERLFEVNGVATLHLGNRWSVGSVCVWASGTPFTQMQRLYMINESIVSEFGEYNGKRLHNYFRLDLSANYLIRRRGNTEQGLNLSFYNVTMCDNEIGYRLKFHQNQFYYVPFSFLIKMLPSINYYIKF